MKQVSISNLNLTAETPQTYLTVDTATGSGTSTPLTVKNITGFAVNQVLLLGELGNEGTEMVITHATTAPSGSNITLVANTVFPHSSGTPVRVMLYDKVEISSASTVGGSKTILNTIYITPDSADNYTTYSDTATTTGYYYSKFKNSITSAESEYSDAIPVGGYLITSARAVIDNALGMINKTSSDLLSDTFAFNEINNCQMETLRELKRWSFMQVYDYVLGDLTTGQWKIALPANCDDQYSNKTIWNFKVGTGDSLTWVDKEKWNEIIEGVAHTTLSASIIVGSLTIALTDSSDFTDSGTVYIGKNNYSYTANNRNTGVLTLSAVSTTTNTLGDDVFSGGTLGTPRYWTVMSGYIYFYPVLGSFLDNKNAYLDYYKAPVPVTSDSNSIVLSDPTVVQYYLSWKMLLRIQSGKDDTTTQAFYNQYIIRREKLKQKEVLGKTYKMKPRLNTLNINDNVDDKIIRTGNFNTGS